MPGKPKNFKLARKASKTKQEPPTTAKKVDEEETEGIGFSPLTKALWAVVFALVIMIGAFTPKSNKPTDAKQTIEYRDATIIAIGKDFVLAEDEDGGSHRTRSLAILAAIRRGDLELGDQVRVPK